MQFIAFWIHQDEHTDVILPAVLLLKIVSPTLIQVKVKANKNILFMEFKQSLQRFLKMQDRKETACSQDVTRWNL